MKILLSELPGGPSTLVLREVPEPTPGPGQVRIAVRADLGAHLAHER